MCDRTLRAHSSRLKSLDCSSPRSGTTLVGLFAQAEAMFVLTRSFTCTIHCAQFMLLVLGLGDRRFSSRRVYF